jgi:hypothetical protein
VAKHTPFSNKSTPPAELTVPPQTALLNVTAVTGELVIFILKATFASKSTLDTQEYKTNVIITKLKS